jgi:hypothetical protein
LNQQRNGMVTAPIALFTYKRPEHTRRTLESLALNPEFAASPLFIYCDGARNGADALQVKEVRQLVRDWPHPNKTIIERDRNWGLANSIIDGVSQQCDAHGRVIVLEDDMVVSAHFLNYMNTALMKYQVDDRVISIHGYSFPIDGLPEAFFIKGASCWGWATWKRGWDLFVPDGNKLFDDLLRKKLMHRFDILGVYPYRRMLLDQIQGRNDSWAVRWYASALIHDKLTLHPGRSLISNIGMDGSGSHCDQYDGFASNLSIAPINLNGLTVSENIQVLQAWRVYLKAVRREKIFKSIFSFRRLFRLISRWLH